MTSDEQALMSAILADPADDTPRLQLADWLEEQGDAERAAFIRVQLELASMGDVRKPEGTWVPREFGGEELVWSGNHETWQRFEALRQREDELWYLPARGFDDRGLTDIDYTKGEPVSGCNRIQAVVRRGLVAEVHTTLRGWMGGKCEQCEFVEASGYAQTDFYSHRPGGICKLCNGSGTIPGHGPAIVSRHPVERVVLSDLRPRQSGVHWCWYMDDMPRQLFELVRLAVRDAASGAYSSLARLACITEQAARDALECHALIVWAKQQSAQTPTG